MASRRSGGGRSESRETRISKAFSYLLRHGAVKEGLPIRSDGFVLVDDLLNFKSIKKDNVTLDELNAVVTNNNKQRFTLSTIDDKLYIRANQGHSIAVQDLELKKITDPTQFPVVVHGTYNRHWPDIKKTGLNKMGRNHIHLASGVWGDENVKSGMRATSDVYIYIDLAKAIADGIDFYLSDNGVILTTGINGVLEPRYFSHVLNGKTKEPFDPDFPQKCT